MLSRNEMAECEWCGGIVSESRAKGDTTRPLRESAYSACTRFFHTECGEAFDTYVVARRFSNGGDGQRDEERPENNRVLP